MYRTVDVDIPLLVRDLKQVGQDHQVTLGGAGGDLFQSFIPVPGDIDTADAGDVPVGKPVPERRTDACCLR